MKIKGHEITIIENHANEPWPRSVSYDGKRMDYNHRWENTVRGQVIYYKDPGDGSVFQGVGVLLKDLQRVISSEATAKALNPLGIYDYIVTGIRAAEAAADLEQRLDSLSRSPFPVAPERTGEIAREIAKAYNVVITTTIGGVRYE